MKKEDLEKKIAEEKLERYLKRIIRQGGMGGRFDPMADPEGWIFKPSAFSAQYHASTTILVKDIGEILDRKYPGWSWVVMPDERNEVINIFNWHLHDTFGYRIKMIDIMYDPGRREALRAGGEILRRFGLTPGPLNSVMAEQIAQLPRDAAGKAIPDISDWAAGKMRTNAEIANALATGRGTIVTQPDGRRMLRIKE